MSDRDIPPMSIKHALQDPHAVAWIELAERLGAVAVEEATRLELPAGGIPGGLLGMGVGALRATGYTRAEVGALALSLFDGMQQFEEGASHGRD